jgi:hypothetical protein
VVEYSAQAIERAMQSTGYFFVMVKVNDVDGATRVVFEATVYELQADRGCGDLICLSYQGRWSWNLVNSNGNLASRMSDDEAFEVRTCDKKRERKVQSVRSV